MINYLRSAKMFTNECDIFVLKQRRYRHVRSLYERLPYLISSCHEIYLIIIAFIIIFCVFFPGPLEQMKSANETKGLSCVNLLEIVVDMKCFNNLALLNDLFSRMNDRKGAKAL